MNILDTCLLVKQLTDNFRIILFINLLQYIVFQLIINIVYLAVSLIRLTALLNYEEMFNYFINDDPVDSLH